MGIRGTYHKDRIEELVDGFKAWREERIPGARAFQSKYDRIGVTVCKWLFQSLHDVQANSTFDYILPLMVSSITTNSVHLVYIPSQPELFRFTEGIHTLKSATLR